VILAVAYFCSIVVGLVAAYRHPRFLIWVLIVGVYGGANLKNNYFLFPPFFLLTVLAYLDVVNGRSNSTIKKEGSTANRQHPAGTTNIVR
jgi:hypothetical protein